MNPTATRPTTGDAYRDGRDAFRPSEVRIRSGAGITDSLRLQADVCVIGTGAGGAVAAKELAEGGLEVIMLEEGEHHVTDSFTARPREMMARLYRDAGQTVTLGNAPVLLPQGRAVGGTTLINSGTCFRTPEPVLAAWQEGFGLPIDAGEMDPYFRRVERVINVAQVPADIAGRNTQVVKRGADALGWSGDYLYRNARGCVGSGVCPAGCPTAAKQHTGITYVARAWDAGAITCTGCRADRILIRSGAVRGVEAETSGGGRLTVEAETVIVAGGAVQTPVLLMRQGLVDRSGQLGRNLTVHPATAVLALMDEIVDLATGVPQSYYVDEFAGEGIMLEGAAGPPEYVAALIPDSGEAHRDLMLEYPHIAEFGGMVSEVSRGRIDLVGGQPFVRYDLLPPDVESLGRVVELLVRLFTAAGARRLMLPLRRLPTVSPGDHAAIRSSRPRASDFKLMAFHPLGTARAHVDPDRGVVDGNLAVHGIDGLYIADGSVVPTPLGVNPQQTIMALANRLACHLLASPPPDDEPEPEQIAKPKTKEMKDVLSR
ncbi:MAG: GMC family oxidoreductase [Solirubrobacterales bacterium]|nr:GMC family oxidoreductase [Solirubrobacterales bacterium]